MLKSLVLTKNRAMLFNKPEMQAVVRMEAELLKGARTYFDEHGFTEIVTPHITRATGSCENVATMFEVNHFESRAYLSQTGQLYLEALTPHLDKVYCVGPSFRAEPKVDARHLTEFTLVEIELQCDLDELMLHIEGIIKNMVSCVLKNCSKELELLGVDKARLAQLKTPFKKISYTEAVKLLSDFGVKWGDDLKSRHEAYIVEHFGNHPVFITHYPTEMKFFNMLDNKENPRIVNSTDLILPFSGEAVGAAERVHDYKLLYKKLKESTMMKQLEERGGSIHDFGWYLELAKNNDIKPHAGCGIGLNRVTQFVLGIPDIRASTAYPMNKESIM